MSQPFLNCPSSSKDFNFTSSKGIKCCKLSGNDIIQNVEKTNLFVVLFLVDYNVSIDEQIIEEEELPMFEFYDYIFLSLFPTWALAFSCMLLSIPPLPQEPCLKHFIVKRQTRKHKSHFWKSTIYLVLCRHSSANKKMNN